MGICIGQVFNRWGLVVFSFLAARLSEGSIRDGKNADYVTPCGIVQYDHVWLYRWRLVSRLFYEKRICCIRCTHESHVCYRALSFGGIGSTTVRWHQLLDTGSAHWCWSI